MKLIRQDLKKHQAKSSLNKTYLSICVLFVLLCGCIQVKPFENTISNVEFYWKCENVHVPPPPSDFYFLQTYGKFLVFNKSQDTILLKTVSEGLLFREVYLYAELNKDTLLLRGFVDEGDSFLKIAPNDSLELEMELEAFNFSCLSDSLEQDSNYVYGQNISRRIQKVINHGSFFYLGKIPNRNFKKKNKYIDYIEIPKRNIVDTCFVIIPREY